MDETGLFWKMAQTRSLATKSTSGGKIIKDRLTLAFTVNATGSEKSDIQELEPGFYTTQSEELEAQIAGFFRDPIPIRDFLEPDEEIIIEEDSDIFEAIVNRYSIIDGGGDGGDDNDCDDEFEEIRPSISEASKALDTLQSFIFLGKDGDKISVFKALNQIGNEISQERGDRFTQSSIDNWLVRS
ncbi:hypothetical protein K3495_g4809 [Podosphaera aphanis]|nr:hypothetical protein K3495_g4809 [Podosphaera aphanis]